MPDTAAESYAELVELDAAHRVRWARAPAAPRPLDPDPLDVEVIALIASMRHVLTSQLHRRFNFERALTTTQRRLKRLSDAGLVRRFQFHRRDGGGAPMCYVIAPLGTELLGAQGRLDDVAQREVDEAPNPSSKSKASSQPVSLTASPPSSLPVGGDRRLHQARHEVHVTGWVLALERALGAGPLRLRGPGESVLSPPLRSTPAGRVAIGPGELRLPGGRAPHDFLRTDAAGARAEVERFETVRPDASVDVPARAIERACAGERGPARMRVGGGGAGEGVEGGGAMGVCLLIERDDRLPVGGAAAKLQRYDHLLAGWSVCLPRFSGRGAGRVGRVAPIFWSCSSAATAPARVSAPGWPTTCCALAAPTRANIPASGNTQVVPASCSSPSATSTRGCCTPTAFPVCPPTCAVRPCRATLGRAKRRSWRAGCCLEGVGVSILRMCSFGCTPLREGSGSIGRWLLHKPTAGSLEPF